MQRVKDKFAVLHNSMYKRILIYTLIAAALATIGFLYYKLTKDDGQYTHPMRGVPANCALVVEINTAKQDADEMNLFLELALNENAIGDVSFNPLAEWPTIVQDLMKLKSYQPEWTELLSHSNILFASSEQLRGDAWLMSVGLKSGASQTFVDELVFVWKPELKFVQREFKGRSIMQSEYLQYCILNDCLVITKATSLMEDAIIQNQKNAVLLQDEQFKAAHDVMSSDASFHLFTPAASGEWMQLDPTARDGYWHLSGYALYSDSTQQSMQLSGDGKAFNIASELPSNTVMLDVFSYTDFETGWKKQEDFYAKSTASKFWSQAWNDLGDSCNCDLNEMMLSWRSGECGSAVIATSDSTTAEVLFFGMKDTLHITTYMEPLLNRVDFLRSIYQLKFPQLFDRNKPQTFLVEPMYIMQKFNYVFVAATPNDLLALTSMSLLKDDETFVKAVASSNANTGRFVFQREYFASPLPQSLLSFMKGMKYITITSEPFKDGKILLDIALSFEDSNYVVCTDVNDDEDNVPDTTQISTVARSWVVINHNTKEKETLYQNESGELCLKGADGKLLWNKKLDAEIVGTVTQIDALKNGKLQYAFAAGNHLYVVDRNGKDLVSFPVLLSSNASSPLAVFDYDNTKAYRMIVATENGTLHNHNAQGKMNEGWKYNDTIPIALVKHLKASGEDLLVAISHSGTVQLLKRNGEKRTEATTTLTDWNKGDVALSAQGNSLQLTYTNSAGKAAKADIGLK